MRTFLSIFFLGVLLLATRLLFLSNLPPTLTHDEVVYATQAYSYTVQGVTLDHNDTPLSLTPNDPMYAELPATILLPGFFISQNPLVASHIIPAIISVLFAIAVGFFAYAFTKDKLQSITAVILITFNPLFWQFGRTSYDVFFSTAFYVCGAVLFLLTKRYFKLFSLPFFIIGFFQYQGFKLILVPFVVFLILSTISKPQALLDRKILKQLFPEMLITALLVLVTLFYGLVLLPQQGAHNRLSKTIFSDSEYVAKQVDTERKLSIESPANKLFTNKVTESFDFMLTRTIASFNPTLLFQIIPPANHGYSVWTYGIFYAFEGICIVLGFFLLFSNPKTRYKGVLLLSGIFLFNISNMINTDSGWSMLRAVMSYLLLLIVASFGFVHILRLKQKIFTFLFLALYLCNIIGFSYHYIYRYPVMGLDFANFDERVIASYITRHQIEHPEIPLAVYTEEPWYYLYSYLLYNSSLNADNKNTIAEQLHEYRSQERQVYRIGNLTFANTCVPKNQTGVYIAGNKQELCINDTDNTAIKKYGELSFTTKKIANRQSALVSIQDSGLKYRIYNDFLCNEKPRSSYIHLTDYKQLAIEKLSVQEFCQDWVTTGKE